jgi:hypothetical protein
MARVQLPPDPRSSCITTIVDSQSGDRAIMDGSMETVDAIVLVYDLSREETFVQLEEHWLPLIERVYGGKVCMHISRGVFRCRLRRLLLLTGTFFPLLVLLSHRPNRYPS